LQNSDSLNPACIAEKDACGVGFIYRPDCSHDVIEETLRALGCLEHRGACGADNETGDGAGILTTIPWKLLDCQATEKDINRAVGVFYFPSSNSEICLKIASEIIEEAGFSIRQWRPVPVDKTVLGELALATCPDIRHAIVEFSNVWSIEEAERRLMVARKRAITSVRAAGGEEFYIASLSCRTIVYKAMVKSGKLPEFYFDLVNPLFESNWAVFHRRFSTNTAPRWQLAQPFRMLAHNGEINTLLGNRNWMRAREPLVEQPMWNQYKDERNSVLYLGGSDSGNLDNAFEMLTRLEHTPEAALMQLVPEAHKNHPAFKADPQICDFYEFYAALQEPWDGPALLVYSDGVKVGAVLDRNGLRPARYTIYADGSIKLASEAGIFNPPDSEIVERGRLGPGQMISVDLKSGQIHRNLELKREVAEQYRYGDWLREHRKNIVPEPFLVPLQMAGSELLSMQQAFGYGKEDVEQLIMPMSTSGEEPVFSMGDDTPLAILSQKPRIIYDYFKQRFAQVTNPPIDPLRERIVMELDTYLGRRSSYLKPTATGADVMHLLSPMLNESELEQVGRLTPNHVRKLSLLFDVQTHSLSHIIEGLCQQALQAVQAGKTIIVLSDRGISTKQGALPALLAVGAIHQFLIRKRIRLNCSIVVETGQCWSSHHFACLLGFGAQAICPYLALETVRAEMTKRASDEAKDPISSRQSTIQEAQELYRKSVEYGLRKVLSKLGLSVLTSYIGAQAFECLGLGPDVISLCFTGTASRIGGLELNGLLRDVLHFHGLAFPEIKSLINVGIMKYRPDGEYHGYHPKLVRALHAAIGLSSKPYNQEERQLSFKAYGSLIKERPPLHLRDLLTISSSRQPISIDEVEPATSIISRFLTGGMSLGALSKEAHEVLAIAMNRIGAKSNSGEGGEDPKRYHPIQNISADGTSPDFPGLRDLKPGDRASSAVRQVASARFGVTPDYLALAQQLEIKVAQGAKPGEGGQLPGHKVSDYIASLRLAKPGAPLISPPPHHDIYSIEDLAQLIFDLKQINPQAKVSVKLVAEIGIGTIACGVAKANADVVQISGHDGGTGASPITSIRHTGAPWELGLVETHLALLANKLRDRVILRVDGGIRSGWDVIMAALMGAQEYGFGTIALVSEGCIMARICHTNNCPVGITSHKEALRKRFPGTPEPVIEFFNLVAEEVRHALAEMGYRSLKEIIGRQKMLKQKEGLELSKGVPIDLRWLTETGQDWESEAVPAASATHTNGITFDDIVLSDPEVAHCLEHHEVIRRQYTINNTDRSIGAKLSGEISRRHGERGFKGRIDLEFSGFAGQSFGAFNVQHVNLFLDGEANDYVGKGMNGGEIAIFQQNSSSGAGCRNVLVGNTCLYGATGGKLFVAGEAGERFAVRNSRAQAVVEGVGDHGCEYMTGGKVVVLGATGRNFAAGMTGGLAYIFDEDGTFQSNCNLDDGRYLQRPSAPGEESLHKLIGEHHARTGSKKAAHILANWEHCLPQFWQLVPISEVNNDEVIETQEEKVSA